MKSDASHTEIDLLRRLHRDAWVHLAALQQLQERSPEDDLRLRASLRLEQRLSDRLDAMTGPEAAAERRNVWWDTAMPSFSPAIAAE